jgi:hypothetical protein
MFGFPTGIGALIVKKEAAEILLGKQEVANLATTSQLFKKVQSIGESYNPFVDMYIVLEIGRESK